MNRVVALVDGFNLYYSVREASNETGASLKWLDLKGFCSSFLDPIGGGATLYRVVYFSAYETHKSRSKVQRHKTYVEALNATGVETRMARFKWKERWCKTCSTLQPGYEEKETDVALAVRLLELFALNECETVVLVTGDTDLLPAIRTSHRLYPDKQVWVAPPHKRWNTQLAQEADDSIKIKRKKYFTHQLPNPVIRSSDGMEIWKPVGW
jgi:uncharacterized LabA/DUF88 family protein